MAYRDETEKLRVEVAELKEELAAAKQNVSRLKGEVGVDVSREGKRSRVLDVPLALHLEHRLPSAIDDKGFEAIAQLLARRLPNGQISQVGRTLTFKHGLTEISVSRSDDGGSVLMLDATWHSHAGGRELAAGCAGFFCTVPVLVLGAALRLSSLHAAWMLPSAFVLSGLVAWQLIRRFNRRTILAGRKDLRGVFEAMTEIAEASAQTKGVRVVVEQDDAGAGAEADAHAEEVSEAARATAGGKGRLRS